MDTLMSLKVFAAVAEARSFSAVAERIGLSAAMTSKHVQHLEARVGARLLNRTSRSVSLTEAGATYLSRVRPLLEGLADAEAELAQTRISPKGTLRVSLPIWLANRPFARVLTRYRTLYPEVTLELDLSGKQMNLVEEGFDLALRAAIYLDDGLIARRLIDVSFCLVAAPAWLDRMGRPGTLADLTGKPFLAYTPVAPNGRVRYEQDGRQVDIQFSAVIQTSNETLLYQAACEGAGLAFLPNLLIARDLAEGRLEAVLQDELQPATTLYAVYPDRSYLPAKVRSFLDFLAGPEGLPSLRPADESTSGARTQLQ